MALPRPLGTFDRAQALTARHHAYNIVTAVRLGGNLERARVESALGELLRRHPILRSRIVANGGERFEVSDIDRLPLEVLTGAVHRNWLEAVEREVAFQFDLEQAPLGRCVLLDDPDGNEATIILTFPHVLVDGTAVIRLLSELLPRLGGEGSPLEAPAVQALPPAADALFPAAWQRPRRLGKSLVFFGRQMVDELVYRARTRGRHSRPPVGPFRDRVLTFALTPEETTALVRESRAHRVSLVATLEAAMLIAVARRSFPGLRLPHRYCALPLLRRYLEPPVGDDVIGCYITVLRLTTQVTGDDELWTVARRIHHDLELSMRRGERFLATLWSHVSMRTIFSQHSHRMSTTAVSYTGATPLPETVGDLDVREVHAFVSNFPVGPLFTAQARLFRSRLWLDILYLDSDFEEEEEARTIANEMGDLLTGGMGEENSLGTGDDASDE